MLASTLGRGKRLEQILAVLGRYGLADWLPERGPDLIKGLLRSPDGQPLADVTREARIRLALTELGPTFIKLGQMLSTRTDVVGKELATELAQLQTDVPADPPELTRATIETELGRPLEQLFASFEAEPFASASIGQVHLARRHDGQTVVVKVQHPRIEDTVTRDLEILGYLAGLAERHSADLRAYQPRALVTEFRRSILRELDFSREANNLERFRELFRDDPTLRIPRPYDDLSSTRVLTMERIEGIALNDAEALAAAPLDTSEVARHGANLYLEMIFQHGMYHADPHPGNVLVLPGGVLALIDFGRVGQIDAETRQDFEELVIAAAESDTAQLTYVITRLCRVPADLDLDALRNQVSEFAADYLNVSLERFDLTGALLQMSEIIRTHRLVLPSSVSMLIKVLVQLEGTSRLLNREFNLAELLQPFYLRAVSSRWSPRRLALSLQRSYRDWTRLLDVLPRDLALIFERIRAGSFDVNLQHRRLDTTINRLVHGVLTAALVVAAAQMLSRTVPPTIFGLSVLGVVAGLIAGVMGLRLLYAIRRSGGL